MEPVAIQRDPYGRLLQRLALALSEADSLAQLSDKPPIELEVRGLSTEELALIQAYLASDHGGLSSWHAAAAHPQEGVQMPPPFTRKAPLLSERYPSLPVTQSEESTDRLALIER